MFLKMRKYNPSVDKRFLIALSGIVWSIVGILLCRLAFIWLSGLPSQGAVRYGVAGIALALLIYRFGFSKIVAKNSERILSKEGRVCIFAFQPWKSYLIVAVMIGMGIILRRSPLPKPYLSIIYTGFGGAMTISSLKYYGSFFKSLRP